jgi:hypothetical protein
MTILAEIVTNMLGLPLGIIIILIGFRFVFKWLEKNIDG